MIGMSRQTVYSPARVARGPLLFVAGQIPMTADGAVPDGAEAQTRVVLDNIAALLAEHGVGWAEVVRVTYYLRDLADLTTLRSVLLEVLPEPRPTSTLVEISGFIDPRFLVEIDAVADLGGR
jgi:enamine deaminase RidA (YjgF/YER057c/UK114 family)